MGDERGKIGGWSKLILTPEVDGKELFFV